ncbi:MAG TPA: PfkB family carbohydrate kinase [Treponemataceae bacterium]|jgi:fructose-1-phosphate kinase PfkB-like protein|nr:PfkB family carbohydrate kinase [Treponemataceae bacterium]
MILTLCLNPVLQKTIVFSMNLEKNCVNRAKSHLFDVSGKGVNVSRVLTQLGIPVLHITQIGGDFSNLFKKLCRKDKISLDSVKVKGNIRFCYTIIDVGVTELVEEGYRVDPSVEAKVLRKINYQLNNKNILAMVISGSKAPGFSDNLYPSIVYKCINKSLPVVADYRGEDLINTLEAVKSLKQKAHLLTIKPNAQELCSTFSCNNAKTDIKDCIESIHNKYGCNCVISDGEHPVMVQTSKGFSLFPVIKAKSTQNTTGCGDAFTAGFASMISNGETFQKAVEKGIECGFKNALTLRPGSIF